jgi:hypothetical protein
VETVDSLFQKQSNSVAVLEPAQDEIHKQRYAAREQAARLAEAQQALSGNSVELQTERGRNRALLSEIEVVRAAQVVYGLCRLSVIASLEYVVMTRLRVLHTEVCTHSDDFLCSLGKT